jgi:pimeloyl-ACP methyl ester carboxylesterase
MHARAQTAWNNFYDHYTLNTKALGNVAIHVTKTNSKTVKPLLVYIDGSGNYPLYYRKSSGIYNTSVALNVAKYAKDYTIVLISKPGTPFSDSLRYKDSRAYYPDNEVYDRFYSLPWRAGAASAAINYLVKKIPVDQKRIVVMGYSEGSQVAPAVAVLNKKVTHVVCMVGNALNQLYDFIINTRLDADRGTITTEESERTIDSLYRVYAQIYANPKATDKKWFGATYLKWSSFSETTPLENMLKLNIPLLYMAGGKDNNQTIIDMDYAKLEFLRKGKTNLTYKVYANSNHSFQETVIKEGKETRTDRSDEAHQFALTWLNAN